MSGGSRSGEGGTGGGGVPFTAGTLVFKANPGMTVNAVLNFTWMDTNQITITNIRFNGAAADWVALADTLPKTVIKGVGVTEGYGEVEIHVLVSSDAQSGEYTVPTQIDVDAVGSHMTTSRWIIIAVTKSTSFNNMVPDLITFILTVLFLALVIYAYLKK